MNKAIFLDKDGTLVRNNPYNVDVDNIQVYDYALKGLKLLQDKGFMIVIITNQQGVGLGYYGEESVIRVGQFLSSYLHKYSIQLNGFYYCPHHPESKCEIYRIPCDCRKPKDGMLRKASQHLNIDLSKSWMIGDILHDVEAGNRAGCRSVLIDNGNETEWKSGFYRSPFFIVRDLKEATEKINKELMENL